VADIKKTVEIIFGAKNEVSKVVTDISRQFDSLGDIADNVTAPLAKIGDSVLKIDAALVALAIGGMALAIKQSSEFNKSFALISTSITAAGPDLDKYRTDILNYSTTSVKSLADINASLYTAAQAGIKYSDSLAFIRAAEQLSVANNANLNTTVDLLTGTMNAYGFTVKDVGHLNDVFFQSTLIGKQTIDELGTSMGQVLGIAANAGVSFEELSAAIATLTAKGMNTETAITAVKNVITTLISPSKEAGEAAKALGLNFSLTELTSKGFAAVLAEIMAKTGGSKEKMVELFSEIRAMNGVLSLTGDGMKFFNSALDQTINSSGNAEKAYEKMVATFSNQMQMVKNVAEVTMIDIGTRLEPMAAKIAGSFGAMFAGVKIGVDSGAFDPLFAYLDQVAGSLSTWISGIAAAMPEAFSKLDFTKLIAAFNDLGRAMGDYLGGLDLTKADDLAGALQTVIDIVTGLVSVTTGMADAFRPFVTVIVDFFKTLAAGGPETQETMGKILAFSQAIQMAGLGVVGAILAINEFNLSVRGLFDVLAGGSQFAWNAMQILFDLTTRGFLKLEEQFVSVLDTMTLGMFPGLEALKAQIVKQNEDITKSILTNNEEGWQGLSRLADGFIRLGNETGNTKTKTDELRKGLLDLPAVTAPEIRLTGGEDSAKTVADIKKTLVELSEKKYVGIEILADGSTIEKAHGLIKQTFPDGQVLYTNIGVRTDDVNLDGVAKKIEKAVPAKKEIDAQLKFDEVKLKEQSSIIQKSMEWKAKVDISQIESATKVMEATFKNLDTQITSTGSVIEKILGELGNKDLASGVKYELEDLLKKESDARKIAMEQSQKLTAQQIELNKLKLSALERGDSMIKISADGLKPHLEMILWEVLEAIQVRANQSGSEFLLGIA